MSSMSSIENRVIKCREEINSIKTSQKTQADSYTFYKYRTTDLYTSSDVTYKLVFHPLKADTLQVVCTFQYADLRGERAGTDFRVSFTNPLECSIHLLAQSGDYYQDWERHVYVTCTSNVEGYLQTLTT